MYSDAVKRDMQAEMLNPEEGVFEGAILILSNKGSYSIQHGNYFSQSTKYGFYLDGTVYKKDPVVKLLFNHDSEFHIGEWLYFYPKLISESRWVIKGAAQIFEHHREEWVKKIQNETFYFSTGGFSKENIRDELKKQETIRWDFYECSIVYTPDYFAYTGNKVKTVSEKGRGFGEKSPFRKKRK